MNQNLYSLSDRRIITAGDPVDTPPEILGGHLADMQDDPDPAFGPAELLQSFALWVACIALTWGAVAFVVNKWSAIKAFLMGLVGA